MLRFHAEVQEALEKGRPVVALESTVISHGLPYPENREVTFAMMQAVRASGAVPAVIGLMDGQMVVGLSPEEIERFAKESSVAKVSVADIAYCLSTKGLGATTVSATLFVAHRAGIKVFATGGMGGVHRDVENSFDISADLHALRNTPMAVVCSGVKSILDVPKTLEYLETLGVPVVGYKSDHFALFYTRKGPRLNKSVDSCAQAAEVIDAHLFLKAGGIMISNPIPTQDALDDALLEKALDDAEAARLKEGVLGKAVTPFLLSKMAELTEGKSRAANVALLIHNAKIAGEIAVQMAL